MSNVKIKPLGDRVIVSPIEPKEVVKGGIIIPDSAKEKPMEGKVVAVGPGALNKAGESLQDIFAPIRQMKLWMQARLQV